MLKATLVFCFGPKSFWFWPRPKLNNKSMALNNELEGAPPMQAYPSVGSLYEGNLGGATGVGGGPNPKPLLQGVKFKVIVED